MESLQSRSHVIEDPIWPNDAHYDSLLGNHVENHS